MKTHRWRALPGALADIRRPSVPGRRLGVVVVTGALVLASTIAASLNGASAYATPADNADCGTTATLVGAANIRPDGAVATQFAAAGTSATRYTYELGGDHFTQVKPPTGWTPIKATDQELRTYGFPDRPTDPQALTQWNQEFSTWKSNYTGGMCESRLLNSVGKTTFHSNIWAGGFNINGTTNVNTYYDSNMHFTQPSFTTTCATGSSGYAIWSGLGGWNQSKLIQAGTMTGFSSVSSANLFWEMISAAHPNPAIIGPAVSPGDVIYTEAFYSTSGGFAYGSAYDNTTGVLFSSGDLTSYKGASISTYYDGSTSDYITEAPTDAATGIIYGLRHPSTGKVSIPYILANGKSLVSYSSDPIVQDSLNGGQIQTTTFDGEHGWSDVWKSCN